MKILTGYEGQVLTSHGRQINSFMPNTNCACCAIVIRWGHEVCHDGRLLSDILHQTLKDTEIIAAGSG